MVIVSLDLLYKYEWTHGGYVNGYVKMYANPPRNDHQIDLPIWDIPPNLTQ